ncbi:hypothetical protein D5S10_09115 [Pseudomonas savastanoi]|uniref:Integrase n=2 Tax=Pseudomonas amygdali TaxID=47877 RepID=A0AAX1VTF2_PSEAJ|nr:hypothetical protein A3SK_0108765 [Pseudomonas amygdali pv. tabaci str. 6605]KPX63081.1 hypothetical protein ALO35_102741 [Pseudomonas amygdali pv. lachrymans]KPY83079.1 hypothetical protein ALO60_102139 [Pseudomonas amygdali pv. tabaci]QOI04022.1 hypothetical protein D5S10_09115 [Pseudomonas savastanoi]RML80012.1 hypothetical protein ALQ89_00214 [Pseudomonas amygdali pv. tabaci]
MRTHRERVAICKSMTNCKDIDTQKRIEVIRMQMGHKSCSSTLDYVDAKALMPEPPASTQH